jgi:hypothetical protein
LSGSGRRTFASTGSATTVAAAGARHFGQTDATCSPSARVKTSRQTGHGIGEAAGTCAACSSAAGADGARSGAGATGGSDAAGAGGGGMKSDRIDSAASISDRAPSTTGGGLRAGGFGCAVRGAFGVGAVGVAGAFPMRRNSGRDFMLRPHDVHILVPSGALTPQ